MWIIKIIKIKCFFPPRTNTDASILVYKVRPERTIFNMYTRSQLIFLALIPWGWYPIVRLKIIQNMKKLIYFN